MSSLHALCWSTPIQNCSVSKGSPSFLNGTSSFKSTKGTCLYCSFFLLTLFLAWCIQGNLEHTGFEIWFKIMTGLNFDKLSYVSFAEGSLQVTWLRASSSIDLSLTLFISGWASALLFCCRNLLHAVKNLTPKSTWWMFFSVFWHHTVCSENFSDVRIFVGTIH